ncbi:MAG: PfkB family carbohydrate kinase [Hyphomicrobiales bacterium]|nr:PfkB family carbohydrate kinase [Hyphomicrobiales bacterium]
MTGPRVVCVGNVVRDEVFHVDILPSAGVKTDVRHYNDRFGGPAATAAVAIAHLGGSASFWGRVGTDAAGEAIAQALSRHGVDLHGLAKIPGARTVRSIVIVDGLGERSITVDRMGLPAIAGSVPKGLPEDAAIVLADTRWPSGALAALAFARERKLPTVLDADGGSAADLTSLVEGSDHIIFSSQGARDFIGPGSPEDQLKRMANLEARAIAITSGGLGSMWMTGGNIMHLPAFPVAVRDTTGCGDVFHGAYALAIAEGRETLWAARFASAVAARKAENGAGWDGMPDRSAVIELMSKDLLP